MPGIQYHLHFANGDTEVVESVQAADDRVLARTNIDQAPDDLLPAELWQVGPNDVGAGSLVKTYPR